MENKAQIEKLKKAIASPALPEQFKASMRAKLAELEAQGAPEKKEQKKHSKLDYDTNVYLDKQRKKTVLISERTGQKWANEYFSTEAEAREFAKDNNLIISANSKDKSSAKQKKAKKAKKAKKVKAPAPKVTAKRDGDAEEPGCDELLKRFNDRREAAKKSQRKAKTTPVFTKISSDVVDAVEKAINNVDANDIKGDPKINIAKFEVLKTAAENFLKAFKSVLGDDYSTKDSEKEIKELEDLISKLENKYLKK